MELLGHSDVTMTLNTYSHVLASLKEDAARRMDTALATNSIAVSCHLSCQMGEKQKANHQTGPFL